MARLKKESEYMDEREVSEDISKNIYRIRVALGIIIGSISGILKLIGLSGIIIAVSVYIATHYFFKLKMKELPPRHYIIGLPEYIGLWLTLWSVLFTLLSSQ